MWRKAVLHHHTTPNERASDSFDPQAVVDRALAEDIEVLAVTDHNSTDRVEAVRQAAAATNLIVMAGVEIDTDRGHVVAIAPSPDGGAVLAEFIARAGVQPDTERPFEDLIDILRTDSWSGGTYREHLVLIGGHVDQPGSLLQPQQPLSVDRQVQQALLLDAVEVVSESTRVQYIQSGLKNSGRSKSIIRASDAHLLTDQLYPTWIYLQEISTPAMRHAFCIPEASIRFEDISTTPVHTIDSISFDGGMHNGKTFEFVERSTALIGAPSTGKSLVVDALRFAFGLESPIDEVRDQSKSRLGRSLGEGTTVTVAGRSEGSEYRLSRTWGGAQPVSPPFTPIVFGQTELVRRAMESEPAMALLDVHCKDAGPLQARSSEVADNIQGSFERALDLAKQVKDISQRVNNREDGLSATRAKLAELAGNEALARKTLEVGRLRTWRRSAVQEIDTWLDGLEVDAAPDVSEPPSIDKDVFDAAPFLPIQEIQAIQVDAREETRDSAEATAEKLRNLVTRNEDELAQVERDLAQDLERHGIQEGSEHLARMDQLRARLESLDSDATKLARLREEMDRELQGLRDLISRSNDVHRDLRQARGRACTTINESMRTFRSRLEHDAHPDRVDELLEVAKTGTWQRQTTLGSVRETLDRARLLEVALLETCGEAEAISPVGGMDAQDDIVRAALSRGREAALGSLASTWPDDGLMIMRREGDVPYQELTEGMRALAIKEISFAASALPVITDQPEDAVPPQNVFQDLVPTIRKQRVDRQFVLASHDANIVVAGDVERVIVMSGDPDGTDLQGTLYETEIREAAIELLEGGQTAFQLRMERYGE